MIKLPSPLSAGDLIGVVAPAGYLKEHERYHQGCELLRQMGFQIYESDKKWPGYGYLADNDAARIEEFHRLWQNPQVKAIIALRGGFGCLRLLEHLDLELLRAQPKIFVGFSDITVLHNHIIDRTSTICLHGPGLATLTDSDQASLDRLYHCLTGDWHHRLQEKIEIVRAADPVTGTLLGGNLSSLITLLGTPWFPRLTGSILLLEDVNEPLYRLDRLLTQLWMSREVNEIHGIILGQFSDDTVEPVEKMRRNEFVWSRVAELTGSKPVPIWGNFPVGHCRKNLTVPLGAPATMNCDNGTLYFFES
ncbi:MAG: LD-carboxypeptidase [Desulfofustis sp.]|nr:LD-carboxypeptidase [Desulfofustis sp.]